MDKNNNRNEIKEPFKEATTTKICTITSCTDDGDENCLKCRKCQRLVHYECTQLPIHQLQIFTNTYNDQYLCCNCVRITRSLICLLYTSDAADE